MINHSFEIAELQRQLSNTVNIGTVKTVDAEKGRVSVLVSGDIESDLLPVLTSRSSNGDCSSWLPEVGEQVLILSIGGDLNFSFVLGSIPKTSDSPNKKSDYKKYSDGTVVEYDKKTSTLTIDASKSKGSVKIKALNASVEADSVKINTEVSKSQKIPQVEIGGVLTAKGKFICEGVAVFSQTVGVAGAVTTPSLVTGGITAGEDGLTMDEIEGDLKVKGDVKAGSVSLKDHKHKYMYPQHPANEALTEKGEES